MDSEDNSVRQLIGEMAALMTAFSPALERRAAEIEASGKDSELADKLVKGAEFRPSSNGHLARARTGVKGRERFVV